MNNKQSEPQIIEQLKHLASLNPDETSLQRTNQQVYAIIAGSKPKTVNQRGFYYYAAASAAILLIGIGLLYQSDSSMTMPPKIVRYESAEPMLTLAKLNTVFYHGGQAALNDYFEQAESKRDAQPETITLQELMKEL